MQKNTTSFFQRFFLVPMDFVAENGAPYFCLFTQSQVVQVLGREKTIYPVPFSPGYLPGFIHTSGALVPVIDLDALCGGARRRNNLSPRQLLLIRTDQEDKAGGGYLRLAIACFETVLTFTLTDRDEAHAVEERAPCAFEALDLAQGFFHVREYQVVLMNLEPLVRGTFSFVAADKGEK